MHCSSTAADSKCEYANDGRAETHSASESRSAGHGNDVHTLDLHHVRNVNGISMRPLLGENDRGQVARHLVDVCKAHKVNQT
ncbi:galactose oxidase precursor [Penicillium alfredii]|uniref:Galactose oxidase n=1 Tax=Penicillium alfredii TaxID=1506179 RepID=A0A9W9FLA3_9EURO|nr:galactose oxidase precursor [Penicillium alfredii]KAJ5102306.1 galactose oxidase precursor [Penicillium alfredii]